MRGAVSARGAAQRRTPRCCVRARTVSAAALAAGHQRRMAAAARALNVKCRQRRASVALSSKIRVGRQTGGVFLKNVLPAC